jgi:hypothetical protein
MTLYLACIPVAAICPSCGNVLPSGGILRRGDTDYTTYCSNYACERRNVVMRIKLPMLEYTDTGEKMT